PCGSGPPSRTSAMPRRPPAWRGGSSWCLGSRTSSFPLACTDSPPRLTSSGGRAARRCFAAPRPCRPASAHARAAAPASGTGGPNALLVLEEAPRPLAAQAALGGEERGAVLSTGQGSQSPGMGQPLYRSQPEFKQALDEIATELDRHLQRPLLDLMFAEPGS